MALWAPFGRAGWTASLLACCACGPGTVGSESGPETESSTNADEPDDAPEFPELPDDQPDCAPRGGNHALLGMHTIIEGTTHYLQPSDLEPTPEGLLALMYWPDHDDDTAPEVWASRLDDKGAPTGDPFPLLERQFVDGPRAHSVGDEFMLTFCGVWSPEWVAGSMAFDAFGTALGPEVQRVPNYSCGAFGLTPDGVWTGYRHLFALRDNSGAGYELVVEVFDGAGVSTGTVQVQDDGEFTPKPRWVVTSEAALLVSSTPDRDGIVLHRFDAMGTHLPDGTVELEIIPGYQLGDVALAANSGGVVAWMTERSEPNRTLRWHLDAEGRTLSGPLPVELPVGHIYHSFELVRRPGGFAMSAHGGDTLQPRSNAAVLFLDPTGALVELVELEDVPDAWEYGPARVAQRGHSTFVLYEVQYPSDPESSDLLIAELGCSD